jgi:hypothetical protein
VGFMKIMSIEICSIGMAITFSLMQERVAAFPS